MRAFTLGKLLSICVIRCWLWRLALTTLISACVSDVIMTGTERRLQRVLHISSVTASNDSLFSVAATLVRLELDDEHVGCVCWWLTEDSSWCSGMDGGTSSVLGDDDVDGVAGDDCEWLWQALSVARLGELSGLNIDDEYTSECWHKHTDTQSTVSCVHVYM